MRFYVVFERPLPEEKRNDPAYNPLDDAELNDTFEISQSAVERFNMSKNVLTDAANEVMKVVYEEDRRMLAKHLADICEGRENVHNLHYRWLDKEGMPVWINSRGIVIIDQQGKAEYLVGCLNETGNMRRADNVTGLLGGPEFLAYLRGQKRTHYQGIFYACRN